MFDIQQAAGERIFALRSAFTSPEGSCPFFNPLIPSGCMFYKYTGNSNHSGTECIGIHYHYGLLCLRITQFLSAMNSYIPYIEISG